ncbi:MAG TPA: hypothetical protein DC048_10410 [Planctomycetaceae bacterium]|nr:hypothetical protein [Planctomycetaceae bacterium]
MAEDMPRSSKGIPPVRLAAGGLIAAACGVWLTTTVISHMSPPTGEPRAMAGALVARGRTLLEARRLAAAYDCFAEAVRLDPSAADGHRGLAAVAYDQGSLMQAVTHLEHAAALDPADGRPWRMIGHICRDLDHHERAVSSYREALGRELAPATRAEVRVELAEELLALGDAAGALAELPDDTPGGLEPLAAVMCRAEAIWITDGPEAAHRIAEAVADRFPDDAGLLGLQGRLLVDQGRWQAAIVPLERAVDLDPHDLATLQALATACDRLGRTDDAARTRSRREAIQAALERLNTLGRAANADAWNASVREELAATCEELGRNDLAAMWRHAAAQARSRVSATPRDLP